MSSLETVGTAALYTKHGTFLKYHRLPFSATTIDLHQGLQLPQLLPRSHTAAHLTFFSTTSDFLLFFLIGKPGLSPLPHHVGWRTGRTGSTVAEGAIGSDVGWRRSARPGDANARPKSVCWLSAIHD